MLHFHPSQRWVVVICTTVASLLGAASLITVSAQYRFDHWTPENGMPSNSVWELRQTRDGYLWMTTGNGLVRFDGVRLTVFDKNSSPAFPSNRCVPLLEDRAGNLWIGTEDAGLVRYRAGVFTQWTTKDGLPGNFVDWLDEDDAGGVLIYTDQGVARWHDGRMTRLPLTPRPFLTGLAQSELKGYYRYLTFALRRTANGTQLFKRGRWLPFPSPPHDTPPQPRSYLTEDTQGRVWYRSDQYSREIYSVDESGTRVFAIPSEPRGFVSPFYQDQQGRLWGNNTALGVTIWKDGKTVPLLPQGLNWHTRVLEDREGNLWVGTADQGLLRVVEQSVSFLQLPGGPLERYVYPLLEDRVGNVWISGGTRGLMRYDKGRFTRFPLVGAKLPLDISAFFEERDGSLLIGTFIHGVTRFRAGAWRVASEFSTVKGRIDVIYRDRQGDLWFGGVTGLYRQSAAGQWTHYGPAEGLPSTHVKTLLEDQQGRLWIGGTGGLSLWQHGKFTNWTAAEGLIADRVVTLYQDKEQTLWAGTFDGGLFRLKQNATGWQLTRYTMRDGMFSNQVKQILPDTENGQDYFWIGSEQGIYRLRKQELNDYAEGRVSAVSNTHFGKLDGLLNLDCVGGFQPAGFKARDGRLWIPTMDGIAVIDPRKIVNNLLPPAVVIEDCLLNRQNVAFAQGLRIHPGQDNLEINYTGLSFRKAEQVRFRYRLEGLDRDWTEAGTRRTAYYPHLPPGSYTFQVTAANSDGIWNTEGQSLRIIVVPPFYRRWWFLTLAALSVAGVALLTVRYRFQQLDRARATQQQFSRQLIASQEAERKRIAAELHDSLGQHLVVIKNLALMWLQTPNRNGDTRQQIEDISATTSQAISEVKEISYNLRPYQLDRIGLTKAIEALLKKAEAASGIRFQSEMDDLQAALPKEAEINFYRIVQECVNNILKHSQATEATISIRRRGSQLQMTLQDNGKGFTPGVTSENAAPGGFGLLGISERAQLLGGQAVIRSAPGQGTTIQLEIELSKGGALL